MGMASAPRGVLGVVHLPAMPGDPQASLAAGPLLAPLCDGAIVGTAFKRDGQVRAPVDPARVQALCDAVRPLLRCRLG